MLISVERLLEDLIAGQDHDDGEVLVDEGKDTVLQLTRHDSLAVKVGNFLDLESTLEGSGELATTSKEQQRLLVLEDLLAELLDRVVEFKNVSNLARDVGQSLDNLVTTALLGCAVLAQRQSKHNHGNELRGIGLGRGNTDFRTSVDVDTAVGEHGDGGSDDVDDTNRQGTALQAVAKGHERVGGFTRLRDEDTGVITEDRSFAVKEIRGQLDSDGDLCELFKDTTDSHARVVASTAGDEDDSAATADGGDVRAQATKSDSLVLDVQTTSHGVDDGLGLLEDFLLHEVVELALHDLLELKLKSLDGTDIGAAVGLLQSVDVERPLVDVGNVVVLEI